MEHSREQLRIEVEKEKSIYNRYKHHKKIGSISTSPSLVIILYILKCGNKFRFILGHSEH